jgi:aerobic-type carbon monoxide dehydrogenase small subunit (CoxS/CutS family)
MANDRGSGVQSTRGLSRRNFLKGIGGGAVASSVVPALMTGIQAAPATDGVTEARITLNINGRSQSLEVQARETLANVLRNRLDLTGSKVCCDRGECGACTVLVDGQSTYSCMTLAMDAVGREITTIEGLAQGEQLHPCQQAMVEFDGYQCGFCTPGQIMSMVAMLKKTPNPTLAQVKHGMSGNICRCAAYPNIFKAALAAADMMRR